MGIPDTVRCPGAPSLPWVRTDAFPSFTRAMRCSESLSSLPPHFVFFARRYHAAFLFRSRVAERDDAGLRLIARYPLPGISRGNGRASQVPGRSEDGYGLGAERYSSSRPAAAD